MLLQSRGSSFILKLIAADPMPIRDKEWISTILYQSTIYKDAPEDRIDLVVCHYPLDMEFRHHGLFR